MLKSKTKIKSRHVSTCVPLVSSPLLPFLVHFSVYIFTVHILFPHSLVNVSFLPGAPAGFQARDGGQNSAQSAEKFFSFAHPGFQFVHLPYITVAHPAHRTEADLREKASLATNQEGPITSPPLPSPTSDLALQLGLHTPGL